MLPNRKVPTLAEIPLGRAVKIQTVDGARAFRRRLLEMGLVPGTPVRVVTVAPDANPTPRPTVYGVVLVQVIESVALESV